MNDLLFMIIPTKASLGWQRIDKFCEGIILLLMKTNKCLVTTLKSFFFIRAPSAIQKEEVLEMKGTNQSFNKSKSYRI